MKTTRRELREIALVHAAIAAFICVAFLVSALPTGIVSGPVVDLGQVRHSLDAVSYPYFQ